MQAEECDSRVEQAIDANTRLIALPTFTSALIDLKRRRPDLIERIARHIELMGTGSEHQRKKLKSHEHARYRTRIGDCRLLDEPLAGRLEGHVALLYVDSRDRVYRWSDSHPGSFQQSASAAYDALRSARDAKGRQATKRESISEVSPTYGARYGSLLAESELEALGIPPAQHPAILAAAPGTLSPSRILTRAQIAAVDRRFDELRARGTSSEPLGDDAETMEGTPSDIARAIRAPLTAFLLALSKEQRSIIKRKSQELLVVKGAAGSGKTIVGLHRIRHWYEELDLYPKPILFTCYNNVLAHSAKQLLRDVLRADVLPSQVKVSTAYRLLLEVLREFEPGWQPKLVGEPQLLPAIRRARRTTLGGSLSGWSDDSLLREILDVVYGRALLRREQYVGADRSGLGKTRQLPTTEDKATFWRFYQAVRADWAKHGIAPWEVVPAHLLGILRKKPPKEARYHGIVVDEVQDLTPSVLQALTLLQGSQRQQRMVLLGDAAQSVYRSPFRWKHAGVDARGHAVVIHRCYRCTPRILQAAVPLIASQGDRFQDDLVLPTASGRAGSKVLLRLADTEGEEEGWIVGEILQKLRAGANVAGIAILANSKAVRARIGERLKAKGIACVEYEGGITKSLSALDTPAIKLLSIASSKGIEFPIVFVPRIVEEQFPSRGADEESIDRARRLLYTAMTRAGRELLLSAPAKDASQHLADLSGTGHVE